VRRPLGLLALGFALWPGLSGSSQAQRIESPPGTLPPPMLGSSPEPGTPPSVPSAPAMPALIMDLSEPRVSITSAFQGEKLLLFGMFDPPGEIVVVVAGPSARETVLRKERVLGLWLNTGRQAFDDVPAYYSLPPASPCSACWRAAPAARSCRSRTGWRRCARSAAASTST